MSCPAVRQTLQHLLKDSRQSNCVPAFLVPALSTPTQHRCFSSTSPSSSRIGKTPVYIPPEVSLRFYDLPQANTRSRKKDVPSSAVDVVGPLGSMTLNMPPYVALTQNEATRKAAISVQDPTQDHQRAMWGTTRAHLQNYVMGVSEGHTCILRLVGVGYRATIESSAITKQPEYPGQQFVSLKVGYAHPIELGVPQGVKASTPQPTRILLEGVNKEVVTQFAAEIREWRIPEPYKGKGIFVNDETIKLKAKKIK